MKKGDKRIASKEFIGKFFLNLSLQFYLIRINLDKRRDAFLDAESTTDDEEIHKPQDDVNPGNKLLIGKHLLGWFVVQDDYLSTVYIKAARIKNGQLEVGNVLLYLEHIDKFL